MERQTDGAEPGGRWGAPPHRDAHQAASLLVSHLQSMPRSGRPASHAPPHCRGCSGFIYMGIVLLTPAIGAADGSVLQCQSDGTASWSNADFTAVMVTCVAEAPGFLVVMLLSDRVGRRW